MTPNEIKKAIKSVIKNGNWMIRADNDGISPSCQAKGFKWNCIGEWTTATDWEKSEKCGHGLHGQSSKCGGYISGKRLVFCEYDPSDMIELVDKIKVKSARILMIGLPTGLHFLNDLNLRGTQITQLPDGLSVGGEIYGLKNRR